MRIFYSVILFLIFGMATVAQPIERKKADSLLRVLSNTKSGAERISLLIQLAQFHIFKPGENQIDFDSATTYLTEARRLTQSSKSISLSGQLLLTESFILREKGQKNEAMEKVRQAVAVLESSGDKKNLGKAYSELSGYYNYNDEKELKERIRFMELALPCFEQIGDLESVGTCHQSLGDLYYNAYNDSAALRHLKLSLDAFRSVNHIAVQGIYVLMGGIYEAQDDNKQALNFNLLALKTAESVGDTSIQLCQINNSIGKCFERFSEFRKATDYYSAALRIAEKYKDNNSIYVVAANLATNWAARGDGHKALLILNDISAKYERPHDPEVDFSITRCYLNSYTAIKEYNKAEFYCTQLLQGFDNETTGTSFRSEALEVAILFYISSGQYKSAIKYLDKHKKLTAGSASGTWENLSHWFMLDTSTHNYNAAVKHLLAFNRLNDSLFNATKSKQLQELEVEYSTAKKEDSLKQQTQHIVLLQQKNDLQQTNLTQANLIKNITIAGAILTLIVLALLYYQFRINRKSNKIILQKNDELKNMLAEKEWWLKEVHHRVKNNLHTIICLLESQAMYLEKDALKAIEKSQHRIYAMSLIHQKLYQNEDLQVIDMSIYLEEFIGYLKDSFETNNIEFIIKVEPVQLNLQQAIPVALIINEGVTNAIKYAFGNEGNSKIWISMSETDTTVRLTITDNGRGFELSDESETKSLGMQLIRGLSKELKGTVLIDAKDGTKLSIAFKKGPLTDKIPSLQEDMIDS